MARTFNRRPFSVNTPSSKEANNHFFNHANWKGMAVDKNFLAADQETFEDCNNVYMDSEGLLRSRPAVKLKNSLNNIVKFWNFDNINVYCVKNDSDYTLRFNDIEESGFTTSNINLVLKDGKIFIFSDTPNKFLYYDVANERLNSALDYIYISKSSADESLYDESPNLLSSKKQIDYIYSSDLTVPRELYGKSVTVEIKDLEYTFVYDEIVSPYLLFEDKGELSDELLNTDFYISEIYGNLIQVSYSSGKIRVKFNDDPWEDRGVGIIDYSSAGISDDGTIFYVISDGSLYFLSLIKNTDGGYEYDALTKIYDPNLNSYELSVKAAGRVASASTFVILYSYQNSYHGPGTICCVESIGGVIKNKTFTNKGDVLSARFTYDPIGQKFDFTFTTEESYVNTGDFGESGYWSSDDSKITAYYAKGVILDTSMIKISDTVISYNPLSVRHRLSLYSLRDGSDVFITEWTDQRYVGKYNVLFDKYVITPNGVYFITKNEFKTFLNAVANQTAEIAISNKYSYYVLSNRLYSNYITTNLILSTIEGELLNQSFVNLLSTAIFSELNDFYVGSSQILYISESRKNENGEFLWYFPKINEQRFSYEITGLQPISSNEMGIFFPSEVWYSSYDKESGYYYYYKSKLQTGLLKGADITTSYDGTKVIFPSERGLVSLSYQDFVASTDQALTYLSDAIFDKFKEFVKKPVKLLKYQHWILAYCKDSTEAYLFDVRNNSWWPLIYHSLADEFYVVENEIVLLSNGKLFGLNKSDNDYYDYDGEIHSIDWHLTSQKLHFNAVNYTKHINNLTLYAVLDSDKLVNFKMDVKNYRKRISNSEVQTISYRVDVIRTVVKKVNYFKVDEFQYTIKQDDEQAIRVPLSLSGVTIKYSIGGQVR